MRRLLTAVMLVVLAAWPVYGAERQEKPVLGRVAEDVSQMRRETVENVEEVRRSIDAQRKELKETLQRVKRDAAAAREHAGRLETELAGLRAREAELTAELGGRQEAMRKIRSAVRDNAALLLESGPIYDVPGMAEGWRGALEGMTAPEHFPSLEEVRLLLHSMLLSVEAGGRMALVRQPVHIRDGSLVEAQVLHYGAFQAAYAAGDETGFLTRVRGADAPQAFAYRPDSAESGMIAQAVSGTGKGPVPLPADVTGGRVLADPPARHTMLTAVMDGGMFLWPIMLIGVVGLLLVAERCVTLGRVRANGRQAVEQVLHGDRNMTAQAGRTPAERVVRRMCTPGGTPDDAEQMERRLEQAVLEELPPLERFLQTIRVLAAISPLLGLLGTVSGIIQTFRIITAHGNGDPKLLSAGISEALLTTEAGLLVAIPLLLCHHFLTRRVNTVMLDMEAAGTSLIAAGSSGRQQ
jgi:biopolymer transport protein ExbB